MATIYLSAMETEVAGKPNFDAQAARLLELLRNLGYDVRWTKEFRPYELIEREIGACDALLAIVDDTWTSSTWMASEVTWALGECGAVATPNPKMNPIPVFIYPVSDRSRWGWLESRPQVIVLNRDIEQALRQIRRTL